jgi:hypothetical protein
VANQEDVNNRADWGSNHEEGKASNVLTAARAIHADHPMLSPEEAADEPEYYNYGDEGGNFYHND